MTLVRLLRRHLAPYRWAVAAVIAFQLTQALASLYLPALNADIVDDGIAQGDIRRILVLGGIMLGVTVLQIACSITAVYFAARTAMALGRDLRQSVFARIGDFSEQDVQRFGAPSLITRSTNDVQQVQMLVLLGGTLLTSAPMLALGGIVMALREDVGLSWIVATAVPAMLLSVGLVVGRIVPLFQAMQRRVDQVNRVLREQLTGIRVVRAFVREGVETERFREANEALTDTALRAGRLFAFVMPLVMLIMNVSSVAVVWFGAARVEDGSLQVGSLIAFLSYLMQILMGVMMATFMVIMIPRAAVSGARIGEVLDTEPSIAPAPVFAGEAPALPQPGTVEFDRVTFSYPGADEPVLRDISFTASPGTTTAIIGSTGAGKTTLVNLAARLIDPSSGTVRVGGADARQLPEEALYAQLGLIPQKPYLFSGTVASTLRYGNPEASEKDIWDALDTAQARDFVTAMPQRLESPIAQGGTNVSGGQRQRLAIARALIKDPPVLLFDDAFSALDTATDRRLRQALAERSTATRIVVAQRVATIIDADQILVLENGRIAASGTHRELLAASEAYAEIVRSQPSDEEAA